MLRVFDSAASDGNSRLTLPAVWPSPSGDEVGTPIKVISELDTWPACAPVNASPVMLPSRAHDSGSGWFAIPFLCGSCIRYSLPFLPGAFRLSPLLAPVLECDLRKVSVCALGRISDAYKLLAVTPCTQGN